MGDTVHAAGFAAAGTQTVDSVTYLAYTQGQALLLASSAVVVSL